MTLQLRYNQFPVGIITDAFESHPSWCGNFRETLNPADGALESRIHDFIVFCERWQALCKAGSEEIDSSDFDPFNDLIYSGIWDTVAESGSVCAMREAPVFFDGEITWAAFDPVVPGESKREI